MMIPQLCSNPHVALQGATRYLLLLHLPVLPRAVALLLLLTTLLTCSARVAQGDDGAPDDGQAAKDRTTVQALLRLPNVDLAKFPTARQALLRHLRRDPRTPEFFQLVRRFQLVEMSDTLVSLVRDEPRKTAGVDAMRMLLEFDQQARVAQLLRDADAPLKTDLLWALANSGRAEAIGLARPFVVQADTDPAVRRAAIDAMGRLAAGRRELLQRLRDGEFAEELHVALANVLLNEQDPDVRQAAEPLLHLPQTASREPLPPLNELVRMPGDRDRGKLVFQQQGTCVKCHQVGVEGKQVGPALTEIGSKLSREAMFLSILDPSAAVSFGYEPYLILLADGQTLTGLIVSQTDEEIVVKTAEAIERRVLRADIDEMVQQSTSIMPSGLVQSMSTQQLVDVVEYLMSLKKVEIR